MQDPDRVRSFGGYDKWGCRGTSVLRAKAIAECIRSDCVWESESNVELFDLVFARIVTTARRNTGSDEKGLLRRLRFRQRFPQR
jgi:hypothetical protein